MKLSKPNKFDFIPAALIIISGIALILFSGRILGGTGNRLTAEISINGQTAAVYFLDSIAEQGETLSLENNGETLTVLLEQDGVSVKDSTCAGNDCVRTGKITKAGTAIVCLPGRIVISLKNTVSTENDVDLYAG